MFPSLNKYLLSTVPLDIVGNNTDFPAPVGQYPGGEDNEHFR